MKSIVKMSKYWIVGLLVGAAALMPARGDTNTTYTVSFADYVIGGKTYSTPPQTYQEGDVVTNLPSSVVFNWVLGWYAGKDGKGKQYYDEKGKPLVEAFSSGEDVTLYAKLDPAYLPLGVYVNGRQLDAMTETGRSGDGWTFDFDRRLVTLNGADAYVLTGCQTNNNVHFLVATNTTVVLSNLVLGTSLSTRAGLVDVARGAEVDILLKGSNSLDASLAKNVAGIFCPTGSTVKISSMRKRDVQMAAPTNMLYHGVLTEREYANKDLQVVAGLNAAAIGGRKVTDGGVSGKITIQDCSIWASGGGGACDIGAGDLALPRDGTNACGTIRFLGYPSVRHVVYVIDASPKVCPFPHGEWETPLFPCSVSSAITPGETLYNVFWFPYGTTRVKSTVSYSDGHVVTNEVPFTVSHANR